MPIREPSVKGKPQPWGVFEWKLFSAILGMSLVGVSVLLFTTVCHA